MFKNVYDWLSYTPFPELLPPLRSIPAGALIVGGKSEDSFTQLIHMSSYCKVKLMQKPFVSLSHSDFDNNKDITHENKMKEINEYLTKLSTFID